MLDKSKLNNIETLEYRKHGLTWKEFMKNLL